MVQGVGFRPHVFRLAENHRIRGWVRNRCDGVEIQAVGTDADLNRFLRDLRAKAPPLARIVDVTSEELPYASLDAFLILESEQQEVRLTLIAPDVCVCGDCRRECLDPNDRRHRYPFINCTNCGPRYTIIRDIPYDRPHTTMAPFTMCAQCRSEYDNPLDRRFHAQPNACPACGPEVWLESAAGEVAARRWEALDQAMTLLAAGAILAIKGLGGFHLAALATCRETVDRLRARKIREEKPFAVMFADLAAIRTHCRLTAAEAALIESPERPIVLLERLPASVGSPLAAGIAPHNRLLGVFLPYTPLHELLFARAAYDALVMTSGNRSDEPIVTANDEARRVLGGIADAFLLHNRDIHMRCDDSVARIVNGRTRQLRRSRGLAPAPVFLREPLPTTLAVGAELKNTVCVVRDREAFLSQHIGDLENLETLQAFEHTIRHLRGILQVEPLLIVHDLHPDYLSSQWALGQNTRCLAVQHHHAHIAAVMAEHHLRGPVLGIALDGTGYGPDGTVWGGELLQVEETRYRRLGHFHQVPLPGGDRAVREPWRMALSYLWSLSPTRVEEDYADLLARWPRHQRQIVLQMIRSGFNAPLTSSCGRLFDAMAALMGMRDENVYEGQAAVEWEQAAIEDGAVYPSDVVKVGDQWILDPRPMVREAIRDWRRGEARGIISARFHHGLVRLISEAAEWAARDSGLHDVALGGGVFQNARLCAELENTLDARGFAVYSALQAPTNDGGISLGQAYVGGHWLRQQVGKDP
jgi:hydrogenase maturation protein HypF